MTRQELTAWEVTMLKRIDMIFLAAINKSQEIKEKIATRKR